MRAFEFLTELDVKYGAKRHTIGDVYGKKNLKVPTAKYQDKRTKKQKGIFTEDVDDWKNHNDVAMLILTYTGNKELAVNFSNLEDDFISQDDMQNSGLSAMGMDPFEDDMEAVNVILSTNEIPFKVVNMRHNDMYETEYQLEKLPYTIQENSYQDKRTKKQKGIFTESVDFTVTKSYKDDKGRTVNDMSHFGERKDVECWVCDGSGVDKHYDEKPPCGYCDGKGQRNEFVSTAPEMNVSNSNAFEIQRMLGLEPDYGGIIENKDLPNFMRRLIQLKNSDTSQYTRPGSDTQGQMKTGKDDDGMDTIGRSGPRMIDMGRSDTQVNRYIDDLLKIFKFAQDNDADVGWG